MGKMYQITTKLENIYECLTEILQEAFPDHSVDVVTYGFQIDGINIEPIRGGYLSSSYLDGVQIKFCDKSHGWKWVHRRVKIKNQHPPYTIDIQAIRNKHEELKYMKVDADKAYTKSRKQAEVSYDLKVRLAKELGIDHYKVKHIVKNVYRLKFEADMELEKFKKVVNAINTVDPNILEI